MQSAVWKTLFIMWRKSSFLTYHAYVFSSGNPHFTFIRFEYTNTCSSDYLVHGKDFFLLEFDATDHNFTYPFMSVRGPKFYYTTTISSTPISVSSKSFLTFVTSIIPPPNFRFPSILSLWYWRTFSVNDLINPFYFNFQNGMRPPQHLKHKNIIFFFVRVHRLATEGHFSIRIKKWRTCGKYPY